MDTKGDARDEMLRDEMLRDEMLRVETLRVRTLPVRTLELGELEALGWDRDAWLVLLGDLGAGRRGGGLGLLLARSLARNGGTRRSGRRQLVGGAILGLGVLVTPIVWFLVVVVLPKALYNSLSGLVDLLMLVGVPGLSLVIARRVAGGSLFDRNYLRVPNLMERAVPQGAGWPAQLRLLALRPFVLRVKDRTVVNVEPALALLADLGVRIGRLRSAIEDARAEVAAGLELMAEVSRMDEERAASARRELRQRARELAVLDREGGVLERHRAERAVLLRGWLDAPQAVDGDADLDDLLGELYRLECAATGSGG